MGADDGQGVSHLDAVRPEHVGAADAREFQELRQPCGVSAQQHLLAGALDYPSSRICSARISAPISSRRWARNALNASVPSVAGSRPN